MEKKCPLPNWLYDAIKTFVVPEPEVEGDNVVFAIVAEIA